MIEVINIIRLIFVIIISGIAIAEIVMGTKHIKQSERFLELYYDKDIEYFRDEAMQSVKRHRFYAAFDYAIAGVLLIIVNIQALV